MTLNWLSAGLIPCLPPWCHSSIRHHVFIPIMFIYLWMHLSWSYPLTDPPPHSASTVWISPSTDCSYSSIHKLPVHMFIDESRQQIKQSQEPASSASVPVWLIVPSSPELSTKHKNCLDMWWRGWFLINMLSRLLFHQLWMTQNDTKTLIKSGRQRGKKVSAEPSLKINGLKWAGWYIFYTKPTQRRECCKQILVKCARNTQFYHSGSRHRSEKSVWHRI